MSTSTSNSTLTVGTAPETSSKVCAVPAPTVLPQIQVPQRVAPSDARELSKQFLLRLQELDEGTPEYQYARNTLIEMNLSLVRYVA
ncbi:RNA polymerase sigma factor SigF, partial [Streptomyces sp. NPDC048434]